MKKSIILFYILLIVGFVAAQQEQQYSQYLLNPFTINPSVAGTEDFIDAQMGLRSQWSGFSGAPTTTYITAHGTLGKVPHQYHFKKEHKNWHGVGMQLYNDRTGAFNRSAFLFAYAYNTSVTHKIRLSLGAYAGGKFVQIDQSHWENIGDEDDGLFQRDLQSGMKPDLHFGATLYHPNFFVSLIGANLISTSFSSNVEFQSRNRPHYYLQAGLRLKASSTTTITPSLLVRYVLSVPPSVNASVKIDWDNQLWVGTSVRMIESFNVFVGGRLMDKVDLSYAFEWSFSKLRSYNFGTHELIIGLRIIHPKNIICPSKFW